MKHLIQPRVQAIQLSGIRQFFNLVSGRPGLVSLTIGQPDFPTPDHVKVAAQEAIAADFTTYTANAGLLELRQAACQFVADKYGLRYSPDEVIATVGASQALDITFRTILEEGTEVLLPAPVYPGYEPLIRLCGAKPVYIDTRQNGFRLSAELIKPYLTDKTRCLVLPYPSNPTGTTLSSEALEAIAALMKGRPIWIVSDEIYSELVYRGRHRSIAEWLPEQTIVINGLSKSHSMTGWRIGLVFAPSFVIEQMVKVHQYSVSCTSSISQKAAVEALTAGKNDAEAMRAAYAERLEYAYNRLTAMGLPVEKPDGAFYLFPSIAAFRMPSFDFALDVVEKAGVALVPGSAFSEYGEGYVRLSYAYSLDVLKEGLDRLERYVHEKRNSL
ncbi:MULTISPECIES: aminotransferase A [Geobacillus]|uniref:Aminotransferase n=1 Tax=Geobacillus thermodenitrificans TaxID=33940 RepID=A0ABY9QEB7_GEOTD|nr:MULTISPECIES: aminotransferase A [Geobacillus]ARA97327.1 aromatic amino acid aminotransferase [Geobacillus thermodenitrificans]ARP42031.1 Putative aminotransferase YugH [Geobacillus thermodenitrificans]ATO36623.1 aromatic amino acid aminotransferase [Geobacillus thermodenitrificans]KQB94036.1 putative N-acetyl-LL-diaminopimelate aminotransferase [Geobacillus sp. PA-3]MEC5188396.1 aminotransferase [Geobacillus thermodenitrificans]